MTEITQEYATDPTTGQTIAIDPPLQQSDTPLMGNPVLMRTAPRKVRSSSGLYTGAAIAVVAVLAGGVYLLAAGSHPQLLTNAASAQPAQVEAAAETPAPAPAPAPTISSPAPIAPIVASAETPEQPILATRAEHVRASAIRHAERQQAARAASQDSADTSATVTMSPATPATAEAPQPAPVMTPAPEAPVITPPPPQ